MGDFDRYYEAMRARDPRFDGVFFVGVSTTHIYCRPVCPVRTPNRESCTFYVSCASAEAAGYRPCLRCRPELAPGSAPMDASARLAQAAAERIQAGALTSGNLDQLAVTLGVGARQLRRAVERELGVSPSLLANTHRLLLAKQLLTDTSLRIVDVAFASGYSSVRQFNRTFRQHYRMTPSRLRKNRKPAKASDCVTLKMGFRPPLAWTALVEFLVARGSPRCERLDNNRYSRTVQLGNHRGWLSVVPDPQSNNLQIQISTELIGVLPQLLSRLRRLFDVRANPSVIDALLATDPRLSSEVKRLPGIRIPGTIDGFDLALRAVLGQQISVKAATTVYGRFVSTFGSPIETPIDNLNRTTPKATDIANVSLKDIQALGLTKRRAETVHYLAMAVADGSVRLSPTTDASASRRALLAIPGIGPWTTEYIAMRVLADPDAIPLTDLGLRHATHIEHPRALADLAESWRPWRAYACMLLWATLGRKQGREGKHSRGKHEGTRQNDSPIRVAKQ